MADSFTTLFANVRPPAKRAVAVPLVAQPFPRISPAPVAQRQTRSRPLEFAKSTDDVRPSDCARPPDHIRPPEITREVAPTIDDLARAMHSSLTPSRDARGIIHNATSLAAKCEYGHLHKYELEGLSTSRCPTCVGRNKFATCVRQRAEALYRKPFNIKQGVSTCRDTLAAAPVEYANRALLVRLVCVRAPGQDYAVDDAGWIVITLHESTSHARIDNAIMQADPRLRPADVGAAERVRMRARMPFDPTLAVEMAKRTHDPRAAITKMKVAKSGVLCFENCPQGHNR